jgi:hypothetical protein
MVVSAPYWATVMLYHGKGIFFYPVLAQYNTTERQNFSQALFENLMSFSVVRNTGAFLWNLIIFLGMVRLVSQSKPAIPLAFLALFSIPREGNWLIALPAMLLFAHGFVDVLLDLIRPVSTDRLQRVGSVLFIGLIGYWMISQSFTIIDDAVTDAQQKITSEQIELLQNVRSLIPVDAKVLVIGNEALLEWSPYLLQREVINTRYGLEWKPEVLPAVMRLNKRISQSQTWDDIADVVARFHRFQTIYIISSDKKLLSALNRNSSIAIQLKMETSAIQLGVLSAP